MRKKVLDFLGFIICVGSCFRYCFGIALVGGSIMKIFGFRYESVGKLYCFFLFCNCRISDGSVCTALPNALLSLDRISLII